MITILCALGLVYYGWASSPPNAVPAERLYKGAVMVIVFCSLNIMMDLMVYVSTNR